jgi:hypothetical protein
VQATSAAVTARRDRATAEAAAKLADRIVAGDKVLDADGEQIPGLTGDVLAAQRDVATPEGALAALQAEMTTNDRQIEAIQAIAEAAQACIIEDALALAQRAEEAQAAVTAARNALNGCDLVWVNGRPIRLPSAIMRVLGGASRAAGSWQERYRALIADPEAEVA